MDDELQQEVILRQMEQTRASLSEKLETLEQTVTEKVQGATAAVADTVETVTDAVQSTVGTVKDTVQDTVEAVKSAFDIQEHVDRYPWLVMGGAVAAGYAAGWLLAEMGPCPTAVAATPTYTARTPEPRGNGYSATQPAAAPSLLSSWLGGLTATFGEELSKLKGLALGALVGAVRDSVESSLPEQLKPQIHELFDSVTTKLGGQPLREHVFADGNGAHGQSTEAIRPRSPSMSSL